MKLVQLAGLAIVFSLVMGCSSGSAIQKGERYTVVQEIRTTAATQWDQPFTDGFDYVIPKGTVVEVIFKTQPSAKFFECRPIRVNNNTNTDYIHNLIVPERIRNKPGFEGFSFTLSVDDIGTKLKALPAGK